MKNVASLLLLSFLSTVAGDGVDTTPCDICGDGNVVSKPDTAVPENPNVTCGQLQAAAEAGALSIHGGCSETLADLIYGPCGCEEDPRSGAGSNSTSTTSESDEEEPDEPLVQCDICGPDRVVSSPDVVGFMPDHPDVSCGHLQQAAEASTFPSTTCGMLQDLVSTVCGCRDDPRLAAPTKVDTSCSVCGEGKEVTLPHNMLKFDANDPYNHITSCEHVEIEGHEGKYSAEYCSDLPSVISTDCGCAVSTRTASDEPADPAEPEEPPTEPDEPAEPAESDVDTTPCDICGAGNVVSRPDAAVPDNDNVTCGQLQSAAEAGILSIHGGCSDTLADLVYGPCGCVPDPSASSGGSESDEEEPDEPLVQCDICGPDRVVSSPDVVGFMPDHPDVSCGHLQQAAEASTFPSTTCGMLQDLVSTVCGCRDDPRLSASKNADTTCSVCGDGKEVTLPKKILKFDADDAYNHITSCEHVEIEGHEGKYSNEYCSDLPSVIGTDCGCAVSTHTASNEPATDPEEPTDPSDPAEPEEPTDPVEPTEPADPEEPLELSEQPATCSNEGIHGSSTSTCFVCGEGSCVTNGQGSVQVGSLVHTCEALELHAAQHYAPADTACAQAMQSVKNINHCGCSVPTTTTPTRRLSEEL